MLRRKFLIRLLKKRNIHQLDLCSLKKSQFNFITNEKSSFKKIVSLFAALKLILLAQPAFLQAKKLQAKVNIKKGVPLGVFKTIRGKKLIDFLTLLKCEILPQMSKQWFLSKKVETVLHLDISNIFLFSNLKGFYFIFRSILKTQILIIFYKINKKIIYFLILFYQLPFKFI